jgi:hypothetical protein
MHRTLFAITLAASLLITTPSGLLARLWDLISEPSDASASTVLQKEGPGLDPDGLAAPPPRTEAGPGLDPDGRS